MRLVLPVLLALMLAPAALAQTDAQRLQACLDQIERDAEIAYQDGLSWMAVGNRPAAQQCTALALIALGHEAEGAARLEQLANADNGGDLDERAIYLVQSGNAWLLAGMPDEAIVTLTNAMKLLPQDGELRKDRARAHVMKRAWAEAGKDLDAAIELGLGDGEAYRLRGLALLRMNRLTDAWADVEMAMRLAPKDVQVVVLRGDVREAMRLAGMEDPAGLDATLEVRPRIVGN